MGKIIASYNEALPAKVTAICDYTKLGMEESEFKNLTVYDNLDKYVLQECVLNTDYLTKYYEAHDSVYSCVVTNIGYIYFYRNDTTENNVVIYSVISNDLKEKISDINFSNTNQIDPTILEYDIVNSPMSIHYWNVAADVNDNDVLYIIPDRRYGGAVYFNADAIYMSQSIQIPNSEDHLGWQLDDSNSKISDVALKYKQQYYIKNITNGNDCIIDATNVVLNTEKYEVVDSFIIVHLNKMLDLRCRNMENSMIYQNSNSLFFDSAYKDECYSKKNYLEGYGGLFCGDPTWDMDDKSQKNEFKNIAGQINGIISTINSGDIYIQASDDENNFGSIFGASQANASGHESTASVYINKNGVFLKREPNINEDDKSNYIGITIRPFYIDKLQKRV